MWLAVALHAGGIAIDTQFHESEQRPFGLFEMVWAHGLSYVGAGIAVLGGRRATLAAERRGCRAAAWSIVVLGALQALALAQDLVSELDAADSAVGPAVYGLTLLAMIVITVIGAVACRAAPRAGRSAPPPPSRP